MAIRNDSTLLRGLEFRNSANTTGIRDIEVHMTKDALIEIRIERTENVPDAAWKKLMSRVDRDIRKVADTESRCYGPTHTNTTQSLVRFEGPCAIISGIPLEKIDPALATMLGMLNTHVEITDSQGIFKPLLPDAAFTIAIRDLGLKPFVDGLKAKQEKRRT
jgi:hypothetical protein